MGPCEVSYRQGLQMFLQKPWERGLRHSSQQPARQRATTDSGPTRRIPSIGPGRRDKQGVNPDAELRQIVSGNRKWSGIFAATCLCANVSLSYVATMWSEAIQGELARARVLKLSSSRGPKRCCRASTVAMSCVSLTVIRFLDCRPFP